VTTTTVLFLWHVPEPLRRFLRQGLSDAAGVRLLFPEDAADAELTDLASQAEVMVGWRPTPAVLAAADRLRLFINPGAGVRHLLDAFRALEEARGVRLVNGHGNSAFTAQHAVALLLALTNRVVQHHNWMASGLWRTGDERAGSVPLGGRHIGLLGYGAVNRTVHRYLAGLGPRFSALWRTGPEGGRELAAGSPGAAPTIAAPATARYGVDPGAPLPTALRAYGPRDLDAFLEAVDVVVVAVPLTDRSAGLIGRRELTLLGPDGLLVNVARGPVVVESDLFAALREGALGGAALDVWYDYQPRPDEGGRLYPYAPAHPFHELHNVVLSPHRAASPFDDLHRWAEVVENIRRLAAGRDDLLNVVDLERGY